MGTYNPDEAVVWPTTVELPDDGDEIDAASVNVGLEAALDMAAHLRDGATAFTGVKTHAGKESFSARVSLATLMSAFATLSGSNQTIAVDGLTSNGLIWVFPPGNGSDVTIDVQDNAATVPEVGRLVIISRPQATTAFSVAVRRLGTSDQLALFPASTPGFVVLIWGTYNSITNWWPILWSEDHGSV